MGFWRTWVHQRSEIDRLTKEVDFQERKIQELSNLLNREEERNAVMWADLQKEFSDHKKTLRRVADQASKQLSLPPGYLKDGEPSRPAPPPPDLDVTDNEWIRWQAQSQRDADIEAGITPQPLEFYEKVIRENPNGFIIG